jgi:hypothetical protein
MSTLTQTMEPCFTLDSLLAQSFDSDETMKAFTDALLELGSSNDDQKGCQDYANLSIVEGYLAKLETARRPDCAGRSNHAASSQSSAEDASTGDEDSACAACSACQRQPERGEKKLLSCAKCQKAKYCNYLCQKGNWGSRSEHK